MRLAGDCGSLAPAVNRISLGEDWPCLREESIDAFLCTLRASPPNLSPAPLSYNIPVTNVNVATS